MNELQAVRKSSRETMEGLKKLSQLRVAYNEEADTQKREERANELIAAEKAFIEAADVHFRAMDNLPDPGPIEDADAQAKEFNSLYKQAKLVNFIDHIEQRTEFAGAEKEIRQAFLGENGARAPDTVPLAMFLDIWDAELQVRADTATTVDAATGKRETMPIAARVFGMTEAAYMGARFISVSGGQQDFPFVSSGTTATSKDENEEIDAGAGVISVVSSNPKEVGASYRWGLTSQLRFGPGELENALRLDARAVIGDYIDETAIVGQPAVGASNVPKVGGLLSDLPYAPGSTSAPTADVTGLGALQFGAEHVDAIWARNDEDVRYLVPPIMWRRVAYLQPYPTSPFVKSLLAGRFLASHHIPNPAASSGKRDSDFITYSPQGDRGEMIVPMWQDVRVTIDMTSETLTRNRQRRLSLDTAYDVILRRNNPWLKHRAQHIA